jgi:hypothetical protein
MRLPLLSIKHDGHGRWRRSHLGHAARSAQRDAHELRRNHLPLTRAYRSRGVCSMRLLGGDQIT